MKSIASMAYVYAAMRASFSLTRSNSPIGRSNWKRYLAHLVACSYANSAAPSMPALSVQRP